MPASQNPPDTQDPLDPGGPEHGELPPPLPVQDPQDPGLREPRSQVDEVHRDPPSVPDPAMPDPITSSSKSAAGANSLSGGSANPHPQAGTRTQTDIRVRRLLGWCGAARTPALISTTWPRRIITARFHKVHGEQVSLSLDIGLGEARTILIGDEAPTVSFSLEHRTTAFHAPVHQVATIDKAVIATFGLPIEVAHSDSRATTRVRVATSCDLGMTLSFQGQVVEVMVRDLSLSGAQVMLISEDTSLHAGQEVDATLTLGPHTVTVPAQVRRRQGIDLGVLFTGCKSSKTTPESLRQILCEISARQPTPLVSR